MHFADDLQGSRQKISNNISLESCCIDVDNDVLRHGNKDTIKLDPSSFLRLRRGTIITMATTEAESQIFVGSKIKELERYVFIYT